MELSFIHILNLRWYWAFWAVSFIWHMFWKIYLLEVCSPSALREILHKLLLPIQLVWVRWGSHNAKIKLLQAYVCAIWQFINVQIGAPHAGLTVSKEMLIMLTCRETEFIMQFVPDMNLIKTAFVTGSRILSLFKKPWDCCSYINWKILKFSFAECCMLRLSQKQLEQGRKCICNTEQRQKSSSNITGITCQI